MKKTKARKKYFLSKLNNYVKMMANFPHKLNHSIRNRRRAEIKKAIEETEMKACRKEQKKFQLPSSNIP